MDCERYRQFKPALAQAMNRYLHFLDQGYLPQSLRLKCLFAFPEYPVLAVPLQKQALVVLLPVLIA